jgi:hypothetical protein
MVSIHAKLKDRILLGSIRTKALLAVVVMGIAGVASSVSAPPGSAATNPITVENAKVGTPIPPTDFASFGQLEGYASAQSVNIGQSLGLRLSSQVPLVDLHVFRFGWYNGITTREVFSASNVAASLRSVPVPDAQGTISANWPVTYTLAVDPTWMTGLYVVGLYKAGATAPVSFIPFAVRNDASTSAFLYVQSQNTYEAYNGWGGKSLYGYNSTGGIPAHKVSFDRPYDSGAGGGLVFEGDTYMVQFLEREGYDVSYASSSDLEQNASLLSAHRSFLSSFHDEYWTKGMRDTLEGAVAQGKHAAFFGANSMYWQARYEPAADGRPYRGMVSYKYDAALDPVQGPTTSGRFQDAPTNRPENALLGASYDGDFAYGTAVPWVVTNVAHWIYNGTGLANGDQIPKVVGYEWDRVYDNGVSPSGLIALSDSTPRPGARQQGTIHQKGAALIFNASTIYWPWLLQNTSWGIDARIQTMTRNLLNAMIDPAGPPSTTLPTTTTTIAPNVTVVKAWDFEDGTTQGWNVWYGTGTVTNTTAGARTGTRALRVTTGAYATAITDVRTLTPGITYTFTAYLRNDAPTFNGGALQFYTVTGALAGPDSAMVVSQDAAGIWSKLTTVFTVPAGTATIYVAINGGDKAATLDDISITVPGSSTPTTTTTLPVVTTTTLPIVTTTTIPIVTTTTIPIVTTTTRPSVTTTTLAGATTTTTAVPSGCSVKYTVTWDSGGAFGVALTATNYGPTTNGWTLQWTFPNDQLLNGTYGGDATQSGAGVSFTNAAWNGAIGGGTSADFGFGGTYVVANGVPTVFKLNGVVCGGAVPPTTTTTIATATTTTTIAAATTTTTRPPTTTTTTTAATTTTIPSVPVLVKRWTFDDSVVSGWSSTGSLSIDKTAHSGTRSLRASGGSSSLVLNPWLTAGRPHTITAWVRPNSNSRPFVELVQSGPSTIRIPAVIDAPIGGWYRVSVTFTSPALATQTFLSINDGGNVFRVDDVDLTRN